MHKIIIGLCLIAVASLSYGTLGVFGVEVLETETAYAQSGAGGSGGGCAGGTLCNPLKFTSITDFLKAVIDVILIFAVPIVVLFIMYAGFLYVTARGDTAQIQKAHSALTWAVIGGTIALGAWVITQVIQGTVNTF